ncbi:MAG: hypothetical protein LUF86_04165, partial [Clostridiales bacterium]|nr:hypothetical protein [Clostridiales bacterium]
MEKIAEIDVEKYAGVTKQRIRSNVLVLTENQRQHIIKRRGQDFFDRCSPHFQEIAEDPDYIFKDKAHENTALVSKTIAIESKNIHLVIRLAVEGDESGFENSIITAIAENDKRYKQRLRNNICSFVNDVKLGKGKEFIG